MTEGHSEGIVAKSAPAWAAAVRTGGAQIFVLQMVYIRIIDTVAMVFILNCLSTFMDVFPPADWMSMTNLSSVFMLAGKCHLSSKAEKLGPSTSPSRN